MTAQEGFWSDVGRFAGSAAPLIICDYDGVLAPIVDDPGRAFPNRQSIDALVALSALPDTHVAVVSGRSVGALETLCTFPATVHLVGSHGSEYRHGPEIELDPGQIDLLGRITDELSGLAAADDDLFVETKPFSAAFHYRMADPVCAERALTAVEQGPATWPGVKVKTGKMVIELVVVAADKGTAVDRLRNQTGAGNVLFVGDDVTDEDAFGVLSDGDLGIKVGPGETLAKHRIEDPAAVADLLTTLQQLRHPT